MDSDSRLQSGPRCMLPHWNAIDGSGALFIRLRRRLEPGIKQSCPRIDSLKALQGGPQPTPMTLQPPDDDCRCRSLRRSRVCRSCPPVAPPAWRSRRSRRCPPRPRASSWAWGPSPGRKSSRWASCSSGEGCRQVELSMARLAGPHARACFWQAVVCNVTLSVPRHSAQLFDAFPSACCAMRRLLQHPVQLHHPA